MRPIKATISSKALQHNLSIVRQHAKYAKVMAVVKANAYGHGLVPTVHALISADGFATLNLSEAIDMREAGVEHPILLLEGVFSDEELRIAASFDVSVVVHNTLQINMIARATLAKKIDVYLKMNTGMNRLGFTPAVFANAYQQLHACDQVGDITLMTHFARADEEAGIEAPLKSFQQAIGAISRPLSLANSATILRFPEAHADWVRPGIMLYGATPVSGVTAQSFDLKPVMQFKSEIIAIQTLQPGESVGYGATFTATQETIVGIVACGYADGYPRHAPTGTPIAVDGRLTHTIGRVSMDMLFCDLTDLPDANIGSKVELWGEHVPVDAVAEKSGTVGYELLCAIAPRVSMEMVP